MIQKALKDFFFDQIITVTCNCLSQKSGKDVTAAKKKTCVTKILVYMATLIQGI